MATSKGKRYDEDEIAAGKLIDALHDLPDEWIMCRDMRHAWSVHVNFHVSGTGKNPEIRRELICLRCQTIRLEVHHQTRYGLEKAHQTYRYPDHYQIKGVPRGVKPQAIVQQEQYRRVMEQIAALPKNQNRKAG